VDRNLAVLFQLYALANAYAAHISNCLRFSFIARRIAALPAGLSLIVAVGAEIRGRLRRCGSDWPIELRNPLSPQHSPNVRGAGLFGLRAGIVIYGCGSYPRICCGRWH